MTTIPRRDFLFGLGSSLGALALTDLQAAEKKTTGPLAPRQPMHQPKAKAVIMLFMEGGPSQADTFDPKPKLNELHLSESTRTKGLATGKRFAPQPSAGRIDQPLAVGGEVELGERLCIQHPEVRRGLGALIEGSDDDPRAVPGRHGRPSAIR